MAPHFLSIIYLLRYDIILHKYITLPIFSPEMMLSLMKSVALAITLATSASKYTLAFVAPSLTNGCRHTVGNILVAFAKKSAAKVDGDDGDYGRVDVNPAKRVALEGVLQRIERNYGRGSIVKLGDATNMVVDCVGSGSMTLGT